jgi:PleD family two-component response regulator
MNNPTDAQGVTEYPAQTPEGIDRLLGRAGHALDEARAAGKNRVVASRA